jgi:hypothetical protein
MTKIKETEGFKTSCPSPFGHDWDKGVVDVPVGETLYPSEGMRTTITRNGDRCSKCGLRRVPLLLGTAYMSRTDDGNLMYEIQDPE